MTKKTPTWIRRALLLSAVFFVAACGGDTEGVTSTSNSDTSSASAPSAAEALAGDSGSAVVTIGDRTFDFSLAGTSTVDTTTYVGRCFSAFGVMGGNGFATDGTAITMDFELPPLDWETASEGWDPPSISVEDNPANANWDASQWSANSGVTNFTQDGTSASGTATFVNQWAPGSEPVEGTFEINCG